jgi:hypothetical protein
MDKTRPDLLNLRVLLFVALVGAALAIAGWYRFFSH